MTHNLASGYMWNTICTLPPCETIENIGSHANKNETQSLMIRYKDICPNMGVNVDMISHRKHHDNQPINLNVI